MRYCFNDKKKCNFDRYLQTKNPKIRFMQETKIHIALVDDNPINRQSLSAMLPHSGEVEILFTAQHGKDFLEKMKTFNFANRIQLVLMDIDMPTLNGIETVKLASELYPSVSFVMLTIFDDDDNIFEAIKAGAVGYLLKDESVDNIVSSIIETVRLGGSPMSPSIARRTLQLLANPPQNKKEDTLLSTREMEILERMVEGLDYKETAKKLYLSSHTVRAHIYNIYKKLHVTSKTEAVKMALKKNWF
jgi:DNA-binding NarL/FixJ family response regulator